MSSVPLLLDLGRIHGISDVPHLVLHFVGGQRVEDDEQTADDLAGQSASGEEHASVVLTGVEELLD